MDRDPETLLDAVESGDSDRVNDAIDAVDSSSIEFEERAALFDACFDQCRDLYDSGDGYQRQSVVRFLDTLNPRKYLTRVINMEEIDDDRPVAEQVGYDLDYATRLAELYLVAIQDDDGRVRNATKRAIKTLCIGYQMHGETAPIQALADELADLAAEHTDKKQEHIQDALDQVEHYLQPHGQQLGATLQRLASEASQRQQ